MRTVDWVNATPEQINLWKHANLLIGWGTITPLYYQGVIAGSEFLIYNADKLYVALEIEASSYSVMAGVYPRMTTYNELNAVHSEYLNEFALWNATAAAINIGGNSIFVKNIYFSRVVINQHLYMKFNGYRLNV